MGTLGSHTLNPRLTPAFKETESNARSPSVLCQATCNATDRDKGTVLHSVLGSRRALEAAGREAEWPSRLSLHLRGLQGTQGLGSLLLTAWGLGQQRPLQPRPFWP